MLSAIIYAAQRRVDESETLLRLLGELARQLFLPSSFAVESARSHPSPPHAPPNCSDRRFTTNQSH